MNKMQDHTPPNIQSDQLEQLWDNLLSRQPDRIQLAYTSLDTHNQKAVLAHLHRMVTEPGWQAEQRQSAEAAIKVISTPSNQDQ
jgi:hypothetical protein